MSYFPPKSSHDKRVYVKNEPDGYRKLWDDCSLVKPPIREDGLVVTAIPFYAAQQLQRLHRISRQLRGATKPTVITTTKVGEPFYQPQLDFDLRTNRPVPLTYNNLLDPHLKHFFNNPVKRKVLQKRGMITDDGDVICHTMKEFRQYREMLYWNYREMLDCLRKDVYHYMPKIINKRREIAAATIEQRRNSLLRVQNESFQRKIRQLKGTNLERHAKKHPTNKPKMMKKKKVDGLTGGDVAAKIISPEFTVERMNEEKAATRIQAVFRGYKTRNLLIKKYKRAAKKAINKRLGNNASRKKIWDRKNKDQVSACHVHSCAECLVGQFGITDIPSMMKFLKDPVAQQEFRRSFLLRLMHTPNMDISGTMVRPLLKEEIRQHSSKFRWV